MHYREIPWRGTQPILRSAWATVIRFFLPFALDLVLCILQEELVQLKTRGRAMLKFLILKTKCLPCVTVPAAWCLKASISDDMIVSLFRLFWCPFMQSAQLCCIFLFCLLFSSFLRARFPFQRTISANWWTVGSRVRPNQSKPPFSSFRSPLSFLQNPLLSYFVSYMDSPTPISVKSL